MVTHEERIARFFADRIIRLSQGEVAEDTTQWDRSDLDLESDKLLYTGDFHAQTLESQGIQLQVLQKENIPAFYQQLVDAIQNRAGDGFCPMETATQCIDDPALAPAAIKQALALLQKK